MSIPFIPTNNNQGIPNIEVNGTGIPLVRTINTGVRSITVSYTHLTLPTNREV